MTRAVKLAGLAAFLLSVTACSRITDPAQEVAAEDDDAVVFALNPSNQSAESGCGGTLSAVPLRDCAKIGETRHYTGLYMRTFEGSSFRDGARPDIAFPDQGEGYAALEIDNASEGKALLPEFRGPPLAVDTVLISFDGRKVLDRSSDPARFGADPVILVDQITAARRVAASHVRRQLRDGSIVNGF
ncbi:MAG: hypothetical protein ABIO86_08790 [Sphingomonas sp.]